MKFETKVFAFKFIYVCVLFVVKNIYVLSNLRTYIYLYTTNIESFFCVFFSAKIKSIELELQKIQQKFLLLLLLQMEFFVLLFFNCKKLTDNKIKLNKPYEICGHNHIILCH